jgi:leucyl aminopeptidase
MECTFAKSETSKKGNVVFLIGEDLKFSEKLNTLDGSAGGTIRKTLKIAGFKAGKGKALSIYDIEGYDRVILLGTGSSKDGVQSEQDVVALGGQLAAYLLAEKIDKAGVFIEKPLAGFEPNSAAASMAAGARLRSYRFDKYFTRQKEEDKPKLTHITFYVPDVKTAQGKYVAASAAVDGVYYARDLVSEPPNVLHPESYAEKVKALKSLGLKITVLDEKQMLKFNMGALLGVGQGSIRESRLVIMEWQGAAHKTAQPVAFVGKGVTFDTGGISIKPAANMDEMKYDMGGSAAVVGVMIALAKRKARVNAVGVIGLVENMPDGNAQRPGDIVTTMSGQTVEVLNTDAEGRLVLADALWYTQEKFKPQCMVNLATLTGAITIALGDQYAGLFSNNDVLSERLTKAGEEVKEPLWRFPMNKDYDKLMDSKVADMQNISSGKGAGSITAAQFLQRFVNNVPWAHLDIAGMAWARKNRDVIPEGASGYGVRLLDRFVANYYE